MNNSFLLNSFTREKLREIAKKCNIKRGQDKSDTIRNLLDNWNEVKKKYKFEFVFIEK